MSRKASPDLQFVDPTEAETLIKRVRSNADELAWVIFKYQPNSDNLLSVLGNGYGGLEEFRDNFDENERLYGLLRLVDIYDGHTTIKFVFVTWAGAKVSVMRKARMTTHKGSIVNLIGQAHITLDASEKSDISDQEVLQRVSDASGSGNRVLSNPGERPSASRVPAQNSTPAPVSPPTPAPAPAVHHEPAPVREVKPVKQAPVDQNPARSVAGSGSKASEFSIENKDQGEAAIHRVRIDDDAADWILFGYQGDTNTIEFQNIGSGGLEELRGFLKLDQVQYGLLRVYDFYDGHRTTKFVFIVWVGENVKIMRKARIATHKGAIVEFIGQHHVAVACSNLNEITEPIVMTQVKMASGTAIHVKD